VEGKPRRRRAGGGAKGLLTSSAERLLFILIYEKTDPLQTMHGLQFGLSQPQTHYWIQQLLPVLQQGLTAWGMRPVAEIPVGLEPEGVAISPDGTKVIVTSESTNMLHVIAVPEHTVVANILVGVRPRSAVFTKDSKTVYATAEISGEILRVDMQKNTIVERITLGGEDDNVKPKDILYKP
jgi:YVTN family beta-propeller protein